MRSVSYRSRLLVLPKFPVYLYHPVLVLTWALGGGEWSAHRFTPGTHWIEGWEGPGTGLHDAKKHLALAGTRTPSPRPSGR
jgi:hypothetical protein